MVISQLKEEIFELRRNQIHFDKVTQMVQTLEERCKTFEREKLCESYETSVLRQKEIIEDLRRKTAKLERSNDILEGKVSDKDREAQESRKRADEATYEMNKVLKENVAVSEGAMRKEQRVESTVNTLKDVQVLLKNAESKIESQKREAVGDKKKISELKAMNQDLKNKFDGLMALRRKTERECIHNEEELKKRGKELEAQSHKMEGLARELEDSNKKNEHLKKTISKLVEELDVLSVQDEKARNLLDRKEMVETLRLNNRNVRNEAEGLVKAKPLYA